jgi:hypothetical protein
MSQSAAPRLRFVTTADLSAEIGGVHFDRANQYAMHEKKDDKDEYVQSRGIEIEFLDYPKRGENRVFRPFENDHKWPKRGKEPDWLRGRLANTGYAGGSGIHQDGVLLKGQQRQKVLERVLATLDPMPKVFDPTTPEWALRVYIQGLWNHGTVPGFVGPKWWGKTKLLCALVAALVIPGKRFLGYFEPVEMTEEEWARDVWLLNAETHIGALHAELLLNGLTFGYRDGVPCYFWDSQGFAEPDPDQGVLIVEQLVKTSATSFDLTDEGRYDFWVTRLTKFVYHHIPPLTVVADGVTAMLGNDTSRYGIWSSRFKDLLRECEIPNGLGSLHSPMGVNTNTPMYGVESMGQWDGMWIGSSPVFPIGPDDRRDFRTYPRLGDPAVPLHRIVADDDGLLRMVEAPTKTTSRPDGEEPDRKQVLLDRLRDAPEGWLWTKDLCRTEGDDYKPDRAALKELLSEGKVSAEKVVEGRTRGTRWRLAEAGEAEAEGE